MNQQFFSSVIKETCIKECMLPKETDMKEREWELTDFFFFFLQRNKQERKDGGGECVSEGGELEKLFEIRKQ